MHFTNIKGLTIFVYGKLVGFGIIIAFIISEIPLNSIAMYIAVTVYSISDLVLLIQTKFLNWRDID